MGIQFIDISEGYQNFQWLWNFGDGHESTEQRPLHIYTKDGFYSVSLKVTNEFGNDISQIDSFVVIDSTLSVILNEDFESDLFPPLGWVNHFSWYSKKYSGIYDFKPGDSTSASTWQTNPSNELSTPSLKFSKEKMFLEFFVRYNTVALEYNEFSLHVTDSTNIKIAKIWSAKDDGLSHLTWRKFFIDLSQYSHLEKIKLTWLYDGTSSSKSIFLDGIRISEYGKTITSIASEKNIVNSPQLFQNYPNPFNPTTTINYQLKIKSDVQLKIYNISGQEIKTLFHQQQNSGQHSIIFDASDLSSGIYIYKLQTGSLVKSRKMILLH